MQSPQSRWETSLALPAGCREAEDARLGQHPRNVTRASARAASYQPGALGIGLPGNGEREFGSEEGALVRRALPHHVRHVDPGAAAVRAGAPSSSRVRRGLGERQQDLPRRAVGAAADHREHRNRSRDRPDHEAAVRGAVDRLRDGADLRMHVHPRRHRRDARNRHLATRECGRGRRHGRVHARGDQGLDVPRSGRAGSSAGGTG